MTSRSTTTRAPTSGVRRNLFHHHLSRRPTASSTAMSTSAQQASAEDNSADIVIRDRNGNYQVEVPLMPEDRQEDALDKEKEDARLAEAVKALARDRNRQPAELMTAVQASLRSKVASLQEDSWVYEAEEDF